MTAPTLAANNLSFAFVPERPVLRGITHCFAPGRLTAVVGPNGCGKTTLVRTLAGLLRPGVGRVTLDGADLTAMPTAARARLVAYLPQRTGVAFPFSAVEVVRMGRHAFGTAGARAIAGAALARVGMSDRAAEPIGTLSVGQQQRVALARALAQMSRGGTPGARVLLADEPVSAMDPRHAVHTMGLLRELAGAGATVVVVLHDLGLALRWADEAVVLGGEGDRRGAVVATGDVRTSLDSGVMSDVFGVGFETLRDANGRAAALIPPGPSSDPLH